MGRHLKKQNQSPILSQSLLLVLAPTHVHDVAEQFSPSVTLAVFELFDGLFQEPLTEHKPRVHRPHLGRPLFLPLVTRGLPQRSILLDRRRVLAEPRLE